MDVQTNKESESVQKDNDLRGKIYKGKKGEYKIFEYVNRGGIGTIWKANRISSINENGEIVPIGNEEQDTVAIKILHSNDFDLSDIAHWERFEREIVHGEGFNHSNLVKVLDGIY